MAKTESHFRTDDHDPRPIAALSILSQSRTESRAEVLGDVTEENAEWLASHLQELEGDVTLDFRLASFCDPTALMMLVQYEEFLRQRGNRLRIDGVPDGPHFESDESYER